VSRDYLPHRKRRTDRASRETEGKNEKGKKRKGDFDPMSSPFIRREKRRRARSAGLRAGKTVPSRQKEGREGSFSTQEKETTPKNIASSPPDHELRRKERGIPTLFQEF